MLVDISAPQNARIGLRDDVVEVFGAAILVARGLAFARREIGIWEKFRSRRRLERRSGDSEGESGLRAHEQRVLWAGLGA